MNNHYFYVIWFYVCAAAQLVHYKLVLCCCNKLVCAELIHSFDEIVLPAGICPRYVNSFSTGPAPSL